MLSPHLRLLSVRTRGCNEEITFARKHDGVLLSWPMRGRIRWPGAEPRTSPHERVRSFEHLPSRAVSKRSTLIMMTPIKHGSRYRWDCSRISTTKGRSLGVRPDAGPTPTERGLHPPATKLVPACDGKCLCANLGPPPLAPGRVHTENRYGLEARKLVSLRLTAVIHSPNNSPRSNSCCRSVWVVNDS